ncbi:phosphomevalonate kinase [Ceratobasidium sp. 370]|nr:phosphomevalonate kinase [Ceratobasidium sp. 370]
MESESTLVSAPGKVLIAGGYLVLDRKYSGLVVSTSSRFYTLIKPAKEQKTDPTKRITVYSPQFEAAKWAYDVAVDGTALGIQAVDGGAGSKNSFVQISLEGTLAVALEIRGADAFLARLRSGLDIYVLGANDFYSQRASLVARNLPPTLSSLASIPPFLPQGVPLSKVHKTGLGSSASLITSLVSALLLHFEAIPPNSLSPACEEPFGRELAHNVSQYVHCLAQGKVGSGFDVCAAAFGSHQYKRFDPNVIGEIMQGKPTGAELLSTLSPSNKAWNHTVSAFGLPYLTRIMLADVDSGTDQLWEGLHRCNNGLGEIILRLRERYQADPKEYADTVVKLACEVGDDWERHSPIDALESIRDGMRAVGKSSGVPIEPPEQTQLLDACYALPGVVGGGVPGAGGYDAIWLLVLQPQDTLLASEIVSNVEKLWQGWTGLSVSPLLATESLLRGAHKENVEDVPGLEAALKGPA